MNRTLLSGNGQNGLISAPNSHFMPVQQPAILRQYGNQMDRRTYEMLHAEIEKLHGKLMVAN